MNPYNKYSKFPYKNIDSVIIGLCSIIDGLMRILCLGFYTPNMDLEMRYLFWSRERLVSK